MNFKSFFIFITFAVLFTFVYGGAVITITNAQSNDVSATTPETGTIKSDSSATESIKKSTTSSNYSIKKTSTGKDSSKTDVSVGNTDVDINTNTKGKATLDASSSTK